MGDDERFEYVYKFVSAGPLGSRGGPGGGERPSRRGDLVRRALRRAMAPASGWRSATGRTASMPPPDSPTRPRSLINARGAADRALATQMDRPEWIAVHPRTGEVYCALTNNINRGKDGGPGSTPPTPARTTSSATSSGGGSSGADAAAARFAWDIFVLCGDPTQAEAESGAISRATSSARRRALVRRRGVLWIQTDVSTSVLGKGDYARIGNNQMLAADPVTRRGATVPHRPEGLEITGVVDHPRRDQHVREHPASRGDRERAERSRRARGGQRLAGRRRGRSAPLRHPRHPENRRRHHRRVIAPEREDPTMRPDPARRSLAGASSAHPPTAAGALALPLPFARAAFAQTSDRARPACRTESRAARWGRTGRWCGAPPTGPRGCWWSTRPPMRSPTSAG